MDKLVKESQYFVAWLLFWLSTTIGGIALGALVGAIIGGMLGASGVDIQTITVVCTIAGFLISIPLSYVLFRVFVAIMIVNKIESRAPLPSMSDDVDEW